MIWKQGVLIGLFALSGLLAIVKVGKKRDPTTPAEVAVAVAIDALLIWLVITL